MSESNEALASIPFTYQKGGNQDGYLILNNVRLAESPHQIELKKLVEDAEGNVGGTDIFYAIYLSGKTTPDGSEDSVSGFAVHALLKFVEGQKPAFTFKNNTLSILPDTEVYFFKTRVLGQENAQGVLEGEVKVFDEPIPVKDHENFKGEGKKLLTHLITVPYKEETDGTCTTCHKTGGTHILLEL